MRQEESRMKTWKIGAASAILVMVLVGSTAAVAAGPGGHHRCRAEGIRFSQGTACAWTEVCWRDTDSDGVWDAWHGFCAEADGDGVCDACGRTVHGYEDANGDGICDHYGTWGGGGGHHGGQRYCRW